MTLVKRNKQKAYERANRKKKAIYRYIDKHVFNTDSRNLLKRLADAGFKIEALKENKVTYQPFRAPHYGKYFTTYDPILNR